MVSSLLPLRSDNLVAIPGLQSAGRCPEVWGAVPMSAKVALVAFPTALL